MGADLYIEKMDRTSQYRGYEVSDAARDAGYFRDCYNKNGLFAFLSFNTNQIFSWWQFSNKAKYFNKEGDLKLKYIPEFLVYVKRAEKFMLTSKIGYIQYGKCYFGFEKQKGKVYEDEEGYRYKKVKLTQKQLKEYKDWYFGLIQFLEKAIELKSNIIWNI